VSIHIALNHVTHYRYDRPVALGPQVVRLRPAPHCRTRILSYALKVTPAKHFVNWQQDPEANYLARVTFPDRTHELRIEVDLIAEMAVLNPFDFFLEPYAQRYPFDYEAGDKRDLAPYLTCLPLTPRLRDYLARIPRQPVVTIDFLVELNRSLARDIRYLIRMEPGVQTPEETLANASGSCRDSSWLLVQLLRQLGLAARFASGYLIQLVADVKSLDGPSGATHDFTDLHAWCEVYLPGAGWIGLDPTSGLLAGEGHIPLACTPEPSSAAPVSGLVEDSEVAFEHVMRIDRIWEAPRVTRPYSEAQWAQIESLGAEIDADLAALDVRLTMGGEPTFVSIDDPDGPEWNTAALGEDKRQLASELYHRLRNRYAPQGLAHFGQGKWYPGEPLPRWSLNCFWRKDGQPIWANAELLADEAIDYDVSAESAQRFLAMVAARLGLTPKHILPAYEDAFYYLWRERRLPGNVDPFDSNLEDAQERDRLARVFEHGLERAVGYVLPVGRDPLNTHWQSGAWFLRDERCYLIPGDSPLGYRLPLDSLPWVKPGDYPYVHLPDPMQVFPPLTSWADIRTQLRDDPRAESPERAAAKVAAKAAALGDRRSANRPGIDPNRVPLPQESAAWITRTAMCAEPRDGVL
jgi:transglutaminase-like putative cysteine protease